MVGYPPGGSGDFVTRTVGEAIAAELGQSAVIDNRPGAAGNLASEIVLKAPADGYTLLVGSNPYINKALYKKLPYDIEKDFQPVTLLANGPMVIAVNNSLPVNSIRELIAYAKKNPGKLNFASSGNGSAPHMAGVLFNSVSDLDILHIPFKGASPAHQEMMGGRLDVMFDNMSASKQYVQSGRFKGLVVSSAARSPQLPNVPTVNETGLVKFEGESWFGIFAPAGTPAPVVAKLREALASINAQPDFSAKVERDGGRMLNIPAAQQQNYLRDEIERWVGAVNRYNVTAD